MNPNEIVLYLKADERIEVRVPQVTMDMVAQLECSNKKMLERIKHLPVVEFQEHHYRRTVISILKLYEQIHEIYPTLQIENLGACDLIVAYENQKTPSKAFHLVKALLVSITAFIGAAYSIMAFSNDADILEIFDLLYELIVGTEATGYTVLEASYSVGLVFGILIFFNHFGKKKLTADPTPMEIEMRLYEQDIQTTLVQNYARKGAELDVGDTNRIDHRGT